MRAQAKIKGAEPFPIQKTIHRFRMRNFGQRPGHDQPVEASQHARNLLGITFQKPKIRLHEPTLHLPQPLGTGSAGLGDSARPLPNYTP